MNDSDLHRQPEAVAGIVRDTAALGFATVRLAWASGLMLVARRTG